MLQNGSVLNDKGQLIIENKEDLKIKLEQVLVDTDISKFADNLFNARLEPNSGFCFRKDQKILDSKDFENILINGLAKGHDKIPVRILNAGSWLSELDGRITYNKGGEITYEKPAVVTAKEVAIVSAGAVAGASVFGSLVAGSIFSFGALPAALAVVAGAAGVGAGVADLGLVMSSALSKKYYKRADRVNLMDLGQLNNPTQQAINVANMERDLNNKSLLTKLGYKYRP